MAYRAAVVGGSGYTGAELLRLLAGHPEIEVVQVTADSNAGAAVGDALPVARRRLRGPRPTSRSSRPTSPGSTWCSCASRTAQSQAHRRRPRRHRRPRRRPRRRLPAAGRRLRAVVRRDAHRAGADRRSSRSGMPELYRDEIVAARARRVARAATRRRASLALAPLLAAGLVEPTGIVVDAVSGVSGAGRGLKATSLFAEASDNVNAYGLLTHRHTAEMELALAHVAGDPVQVLFTPHLVPMTRGHPRHVLRPAGRPAAPAAPTRCSPATATSTPAEPFVHVTDGPPATKATLGSNAAHVTVRYDERTDTVLAIGALDNLVKGASGQALQNANLVLGLPETHRRSRRIGTRCRERHRPVRERVRTPAGGLASGIKESGAPDLAMVADRRRRAGRRRRRVHHQPRRRRAGADQPAAPGRRPRRRGRPQLRQRQRRDRRAGPRRRRCACASSPAQASAARPPTCSCADRPHRHPDADGPDRVGHPEARRAAHAPTPPAARPRPTRMLTTDTVPQGHGAAGRARRRRGATVGGMAKGAAMLAPSMATMLAVLTTDVAVEPGAAAARAARRGRRAASTRWSSTRCRAPTTPCSCSPTAPPATSRSPRRRAPRTARSSRRSPRRAATSRTRWPPTPRARPSASTLARARRPHRPTRRGSRPARSRAASSCSARSTARIRTGAGSSPSSASAARCSIPSRSTIAYDGIVVCETGIAAAHDADALAQVMEQRDLEITCDLHLGDGEATMLFTDLTHAYIDENMGTS